MNTRRKVETAVLQVGERLITRACRLVPDHERDQRRQEWIAEQWSILDDPAHPWLLRMPTVLVFPLSLAWSLRRGAWPTRHDASLFDWRATVNAVAVHTISAYLLVPYIASIVLSIGSLAYAVGGGVTGVIVGAGLGAGVPTGLGLGTGVPTGAPAASAVPVTAPAVVGTIGAVAAVACLATIVAHNWFSQRRSNEGVGQPDLIVE